MASAKPISDQELQQAYSQTGLARLGLSFREALKDPAIRVSLAGLASACRRRTAPQGTPAPQQLALI